MLCQAVLLSGRWTASGNRASKVPFGVVLKAGASPTRPERVTRGLYQMKGYILGKMTISIGSHIKRLPELLVARVA